MNMLGSTRCDAVAVLINTKIIAVHLLATSSHQLFFLAKKKNRYSDSQIYYGMRVFFLLDLLVIYLCFGEKNYSLKADKQQLWNKNKIRNTNTTKKQSINQSIRTSISISYFFSSFFHT